LLANSKTKQCPTNFRLIYWVNFLHNPDTTLNV
jgi:hypothetical protein